MPIFRDYSSPNRVLLSQLMTMAYSGSAKEAELDGNVIRATRLEEMDTK